MGEPMSINSNWRLALDLDLAAHGLAPKSEVDRLTRERDNAVHDFRKASDERNEAIRERDEARGELAGKKEDAAAWHRDYMKVSETCERLRATQSSPEVLALCRAARWYGDGHDGVRWKALQDAAVAFAAVERKAEPKPRYTVDDGGFVLRDGAPEAVAVIATRATPAERAIIVDALNAADAAGRKS